MTAIDPRTLGDVSRGLEARASRDPSRRWDRRQRSSKKFARRAHIERRRHAAGAHAVERTATLRGRSARVKGELGLLGEAIIDEALAARSAASGQDFALARLARTRAEDVQKRDRRRAEGPVPTVEVANQHQLKDRPGGQVNQLLG